jgi:site-specific DNA-methyltransferase (adenine-specific)
MIVITLARKPLAESTVARNVLHYGTGSLNIEASRIGAPFLSAGGNNFEAWRAGESRADRPAQHGTTTSKVPSGRWPTNFILEHFPGCRCQGLKRVPANQSTRIGSGKGSAETSGHIFGHFGGTVKPSTAGPDGRETVENWICAPGCPVAQLDEESIAGGMHGAGTKREPGLSVQTNDGCLFGLSNYEGNGVRFGDAGGASRFFKQFQSCK